MPKQSVPTPPPSAQLQSVDAIAARFDLSAKTVRRLIANGELVAHRIGRQLRISETDAAAFLARRRG